MKLDRPLCFFDLEATGVNPAEDRIVDVCVLRREPDGTETVFSSLVNPGVPIPPEATNIHKISDEMVKDQPPFSDLAERLLKAFEGADLSGFNIIKYDIPLLAAEFKRCGVDWPGEGRRLLDSYVIFARKEKRDLTGAYKFFCGKDLTGAHRAEADVRASAEVLFAQVERYPDLPKDSNGLNEWIALRDPNDNRVDADGKFTWRNGEAVFNFGKHKGKTLREICRSEPSFIDWMIKKASFSPEVVRICASAQLGEFPAKK